MYKSTTMTSIQYKRATFDQPLSVWIFNYIEIKTLERLCVTGSGVCNRQAVGSGCLYPWAQFGGGRGRDMSPPLFQPGGTYHILSPPHILRMMPYCSTVQITN